MAYSVAIVAPTVKVTANTPKVAAAGGGGSAPPTTGQLWPRPR